MKTRIPGKNHEADAKHDAKIAPKIRAQEAEYRRKRVTDWVNSMRKSIAHYLKGSDGLLATTIDSLDTFEATAIKSINKLEEIGT